MKPITVIGVSASLLILAGSAGAQTVFNPGVLRYQMWTSDNPNGPANPGRTTVEAGLGGTPTTDSITLNVFDTPAGQADNYTDRISGLFIPPATTNYVFFLAGDDDSDLFLSTDATPGNKRLIAQQGTWSNKDQWVPAGVTTTRSDQWKNPQGVAPYANGIPLVAGQKYWIEAVHHEGGGGDNVGATFIFKGEPDPANGAASKLTNNVIGYGYTIPASLTVKTQVTNATAYVGSEATFTYEVLNPIPDPLVYQWYRNGALITNAIGLQYTFLTTAADAGAQYKCVVSMPASYSSSLTSTSAVGTVTLNLNTVSYTNGLKVERWFGGTRTGAENGNVGAASDLSVTLPSGLEVQAHGGAPDNFAQRASGWLIPPADGAYVFFLCSDDDADLFLSTDNTAANKQLIAQENAWSGERNWTFSAGDTNSISQKRSDQFTNDLGVTLFPAGIPLLGGHAYYIEAVKHEGGGGDNLGVAWKLFANADPTNGAPPIPAQYLSLITSPTTTLVINTNPVNKTIFEGDSTGFSVVATSDSEFTLLYQWRRAGTNIAGATSPQYNFQPILADSGSHYDVVVSTAEGGLSATSTVATLTVQAAALETGWVKAEVWLNQGTDLGPLNNNQLGAPDFVLAVPAFERGINDNNGVNFQSRVSGFVIPATTGQYDFLVAGDDHIDVWLSTDENPNNKRLICQQPGWSGALAWSDNPGNNNDSDRNQMRSYSWTNANSGGVAPFANGITLNQNTRYYLEMNHQEGTGGDSSEVYMKVHGTADPANGTDSNLKGNLIAFKTQAATFIAFTNQPQSQTTTAGNTATFSAGGVSDATIPFGTTGQYAINASDTFVGFRTFPTVAFQWYKNGTAIPGAITSSYTTPPLRASDSGGQYFATIHSIGTGVSNSLTATLTVTNDTTKPTILFAGQGFLGFSPVLSLRFSRPMDPATMADITHYAISGGTVSVQAVNIFSNDLTRVDLVLTDTPAPGSSVTLTGVTDWSGNTPSNTTIAIVISPLTNTDIGNAAGTDPILPGFFFMDNTNAYTVVAGGSDIWGTSDGFNFSYEQKTNDFDVAVRQTAYTPVSGASKGGLIAQEILDPASRHWYIANGPLAGTTIIDGSGANNTIEANWRTNFTDNTASWAIGPAAPPAYPNAWLRLKRTGSILQGFYSTNNAATWNLLAGMDVSTNSATSALPSTLYVGIIACARNNTADPIYYYEASFDNYSSNFVPAPPRPTMQVGRSGNNIVISWSPAGGHLQSTTTLKNPTWTDVPGGTANPITVVPSAAATFYSVAP